MNQKKIIQAAFIIVIGVWISCISFMVSKNIASKQQPKTTAPVTTTQTTAVTTSVPTTAVASTLPATSATLPAPSTTLNIDGNNVVTTAGQVEAPEWQQIQQSQQAQQEAQSSFQALKDTVPKTTDEIIAAYVKGVNNLKKAENFTLHKDDKLNMSTDKMTGGTVVKTFVEQLMAKNQKQPITYTFTNGIDAATGKTPMDAIAPLGTAAALNADAVTDARSAIVDTQGSYTIKLALKDEHQIYPEQAPAHSKIVEVVDVSSLLIGGITVTHLDILYSGTTIEATIDKDGRITKMTHYLPVSKAVCSGKYGPITADMEFHGEFTSVYTFSY